MSFRFIISVDVDHFPKSEIGIQRILDTLEERGILAMFFVAGKFAEENEDVIRDIHLKGHEIGCHGYSHGLDVDENFIELDMNEQKERIKKTSRILKEITGEDVRIFRAPYAMICTDTLNILEELDYLCDSSVSSLRFDFGMGMANNLQAFFAPTRPYHPSKSNIYKTGDSKVLEIPISAFIAPLTLSGIRTFGVKKMCYIYNMARLYFDPLVFYLHPYEVMGMEEIQLWDGLPKRHKKNRGVKALYDLDMFLDYVGKRSELIQFGDILESERTNNVSN
jgi:peptidoglycan/xylan/chitin deacetylase (PgdA/CDA1 family)